jgi:hypothetical protein
VQVELSSEKNVFEVGQSQPRKPSFPVLFLLELSSDVKNVSDGTADWVAQVQEQG